ncbi:MAG TPA: DUF2380 domain-containing protein [Dongiaceae bacterium]|jgi:hypothetical protein|nr:DUF2380 domain-containing protein [Dongiaceae bacterium]
MKPGRSLLHPIAFAAMASVAIACAFAALSSSPGAVEPVVVAVADFDYIDTSGEVMDQERVHAERLRTLAEQVRAGLDQSGRYRVVILACNPAPCSVGRTNPAELLAKAHAAGARLLIYGGIQKMSTLIQYGNAQVVDLDADRLVFNRNISFRGDNDEAWRRAAQFLVADLVNENLVK